jgi:OOP family OmpA-OmpF porin
MKRITGRKLQMSASVFFIAFVCFAGTAIAQTQEAYLQKADQLYERADYFGAAQCYAIWLDSTGAGARNGLHASPFTVKRRSNKQAVLKTTTRSKAEGMWKLAGCYRRIRNYDKMEQWYAKLNAEHQDTYPDAAYWYACALRANNKLDEAEATLNKFLRGTITPQLQASARRELANIGFARQQLRRKAAGYEVYRIDAVNGFAASLQGGQMIYTAADTAGKGPYFNQLFKTAYIDGKIAHAEKIETLKSQNKHTGMSTLSPDGQVMYFTQWETVEGRIHAVIASSRLADGQWSAPVAMGANVNQAGSNAREPFVTADGKYLLFSSDRKGGVGGYDLWCINLPEANAKAWNLKAVNTTGDDQAPFYNTATKQLIFSSNGMTGMGGFDLYQADGTPEQLMPAVNMGFPVNSVRDDIYYAESSDEKNTVLSSDRAVDCCLELYAVRQLKRPWLVKGKVNDCATGEGIADAQIQITDSIKGTVLNNTVTAANGLYHTSVENAAWLQFNASRAGYQSAGNTTYIQRRPDLDTLLLTAICLTKIPVVIVDPEPEESTPWLVIYFAFDKATLSPEAKVALDSLAARLQREPSLTIDIKGYTDGRGTEKYNIRLSKRRAEACLTHLKKKGISASRLRTEALGKCCPAEDEKNNPAAAGRNRRVEVRGK